MKLGTFIFAWLISVAAVLAETTKATTTNATTTTTTATNTTSTTNSVTTTTTTAANTTKTTATTNQATTKATTTANTTNTTATTNPATTKATTTAPTTKTTATINSATTTSTKKTNTTTIGANVTKVDTATTLQQVILVLKGNFSEVIGQGEGSKQKFLAACTFKLSNNNTRDLKCADVRPGSITGSIIVDIKGAPKNLDKLVQELKTDKSFALNGYADLTVDKVDVISVTTTTKNLTEKEIWEQIIKYLMENVGILVGIIVAAVLVLVIIGISIFLCYKCCTCCKCCKRCKCKRGVCCQSCQKDEEDCKELEMSSYHRTETLVESQLLKQQEGSQTMVMSNPVVVDVAGGSTMPKATVVVTDAQMIEKSDVLSKSNIEAGAQSNPQQLDEENAEIANTPDNAAGQAK